MKNYADYDYGTIPLPDLDADIHWVQLPTAVWKTSPPPGWSILRITYR